MNHLRRLLSAAMLLVAPLELISGASRETGSPRAYRVYVGDYTSKTSAKGIYEFQFDAATGKMSALELAAQTEDPSWILIHPSKRYLYAANERGGNSSISAFAVRKDGKLQLLNQRPALGADPCHLAFDRTGKFLLTANYSSGSVAVLPILADGSLGEHTALVTNQGTPGPKRERQEGPHAHWVGTSPDNRTVYVADLGLDRVLVYGFDAGKGTLTRAGEFTAKPGTGPRHVAFSKDEKFMYVLGEIESTVSVFSLGQATFQPIDRVPMLPEGFSGRNDAAEIAIHPSGRFLYASNRGRDSIVVYAIDPLKGTLSEIAEVPSGGKEPRHFSIDPSGQFLLAENQFSDSIVEFRIDPSTGKIAPTGESLAVPSPVCAAFFELE